MTEAEKLRWILGELSIEDRTSVEDHLAACPSCRDDAEALGAVLRTLQASPAMFEGDAPCLDERQIADWVDGVASGHERATAISHILSCHKCRRSVASVAAAVTVDSIRVALDQIHSTPGPAEPSAGRRRAVGHLIPLAAAAGIIALLFVWPTDFAVDTSDPHRAAEDVLAARPIPEHPVGEQPLPVSFRWSEVASADGYRITLFDESGSVVWEVETNEAFASPPETMVFQPGDLYLWRVDARVGWERWVASELAQFTITEN